MGRLTSDRPSTVLLEAMRLRVGLHSSASPADRATTTFNQTHRLVDIRCSYEFLPETPEYPARKGEQIHSNRSNKGFAEGATESVKYMLTFVGI